MTKPEEATARSFIKHLILPGLGHRHEIEAMTILHDEVHTSV